MSDSLERLSAGVRPLGLELSEQQLAQFQCYRAELLEWNTRFNLTAITDPEEVLTRHFLDSLSLLLALDRPRVRPTLSLLDIGTGAGFPGLPLKIVRADWQITLVDATGKKVQFLQHVIETLGLEGIEAVQGRAEELAHKPAYRGAFDVVTARAVASFSTLLEYSAPFSKVRGLIVLPKKGLLDEELAQGKRAAQQLGTVLKADLPVTLPELADGRRLFIWEQRMLCPSQFPRNGGTMSKKPLGGALNAKAKPD